MPPLVSRGQIWLANIGLAEAKRFVIVSNNLRNRNLQDVLGVRLTTANKGDFPSIVRFGPGEIGQTQCSAVVDDIWLLRKDWLEQMVGGLTQPQMRRIEDALKAALAL